MVVGIKESNWVSYSNLVLYNLSINCLLFLGVFLLIFMIFNIVMPSVNKYSFVFSFPVFIPFISFAWVIYYISQNFQYDVAWVVRENILVLLLILGKEACSFSPLSMTFAVHSLPLFGVKLRMFPSVSSLLRIFIMSWWWIF